MWRLQKLVLDVNQYPLPKPDDLFATLVGGKLVLKLDLSQAYQQLTLDKELAKYVTVNTHCELYRYTSCTLPEAKEHMWQSIPHVICYVDDI